MDDFEDRLRKKLKPAAVRGGPIRACLFLAGYELLKGEMFGGIRRFLLLDDSKYDREVRHRDSSELKACGFWLEEIGAFSAAQVAQVLQIRDLRNEVAHEVPRLIIDPSARISAATLEQVEHLIRSLGRFWGRVAVDADPEFDNRIVSDDDIDSMPTLVMGYVMDVCREFQE